MNLQPLQATNNALFVADSIAFYGVKLSLFCGLLLILLGRDQAPLGRIADYYGCFLLMLSGLIYLSAAADMITMFLSMELISIPTVVLLSITQGKTPGMEATLKYFILASFSSAIFLFGASYLYGIAGTTSLADLAGKLVLNRQIWLVWRSGYCSADYSFVSLLCHFIFTHLTSLKAPR